jgi:hypothetical protein
MPLTLTITEGVLSKAQAVSAVEKLTDGRLLGKAQPHRQHRHDSQCHI